jgi:PAS domain S-box-containing protein
VEITRSSADGRRSVASLPLQSRLTSISLARFRFVDPVSLVIIEDSIDDYELLLARLRSGSRPIRARRAETPDELVEALRGGGIDAVISDHRLPRFGSLEALRIVRAHDRDLPFLIVSGAIGEEVAVEAMREGADDYLMKDKLGRLEPALARALDAAAARRQQRLAEAALLESESRFAALTANLPGMVFHLEKRNDRFSLVYVSEGARALFGVAPEVLCADPERWFACLVPDDAAALRALLSEVTAAGEVRWIGRVDRDGQEAWVEISASARTIAAGHVIWDGIVSDITLQKRAEAALRSQREELRLLASHLTRVREQEREAIAREIHDDVGSTLTALKFELTLLRGDASLDRAIDRAHQLVDNAISSSTRIMHDLRPGILDEGVVAALEWQARSFEQRMGIACRFASSHETIPLGPEQAIAVFRICQEALNNVAKYAEANAVDIRLRAASGRLSLEIEDDGKGIAPSDLAKPDRFGLRGMRERAHSLGGTVAFEAAADTGALVRVVLPLAQGASDSMGASA